MAKQDDRNRTSIIDTVDAMYDRIIELEQELDQLQDRYDALEEDFIEYKKSFN